MWWYNQPWGDVSGLLDVKGSSDVRGWSDMRGCKFGLVWVSNYALSISTSEYDSNNISNLYVEHIQLYKLLKLGLI